MTLDGQREGIRAKLQAAKGMEEWEDVLRLLDARRGNSRSAIEPHLERIVQMGIPAVEANQKAPVRDDTRKELDGLVKALERVQSKTDNLNPYAASTFEMAYGTDAPDANETIGYLLAQAKAARQQWSGQSFPQRGTAARREIIKMCWRLVTQHGLENRLPKNSADFRDLCTKALDLCGDDADGQIGGLIRELGGD